MQLAFGVAFFAFTGTLTLWIAIRGILQGDFKGSTVHWSRINNPISYWAAVLSLCIGGAAMLFLAINTVAHFREIESTPLPPHPWPKFLSIAGIEKALIFLLGIAFGLSWLIFPQAFSRADTWQSSIGRWALRIAGAGFVAAGAWGIARFF